MSIKLEHSIREVTNRFELALSGFIDSDVGRELDVSEPYFRYAIAKAARTYAKSYLESHAFSQLLGMQKSVALSFIYILQRFQNHTSIRNFDSVSELEEAFTRDLQRNNQNKGSNLLGLNIANEEEYLTILGDAATGKTTFLKYIGLEALRYPEGRYQHDVIPIFIYACKLCSESDTLLLAITEELEKCDFPFAKDLAIWLLENGKLLVLIDGLNESVLPQTHLCSHVRDFVKTYPLDRYIVSSRLVSYQNNLGQFLELVVQAWDDLHIQEYIHKWFGCVYGQVASLEGAGVNALPNAVQGLDQSSIKAQQCWEVLQNNAVARDLANSPLSLSLLCLLCDRRYSLPSNLSGLYKNAIHLLLEDVVVQHQQLHNVTEKHISTEVLYFLITEIAYRSFESHHTILLLEEVRQQIQSILMSCRGNLQGLDVEFVIQVLQQVGICKVIKSKMPASLTFCHTTFREYLVACYIYNRNRAKLLVSYHLSDRRWQQVFLLLSGMMVGNAEELLLSIESQALTFISTSGLRDIVEWLDQITSNSQGNLRNVVRRIAALFLIRPRFLSELSLSLLLSRMLGLARDLYREFDQSINFDRVFASDLSLSLAHALDFDSQTEISLTIQLCQNLDEAMQMVKFDSQDISFKLLHSKLDALSGRVPSFEQPYEVREKFRQAINSTWLQTLHLPKELNRISAEEVEALENYLYANLLMINCKKMAIAVSTRTWEEIEARILRLI
jgi:hypothetical protein